MMCCFRFRAKAKRLLAAIRGIERLTKINAKSAAARG
jgi:hypothetical protein